VSPARYDGIGRGYDTTRRADPDICKRLIHHLRLDCDSRCLDLACGTGNYTVSMQLRGFSVVGVDLSCEMLSKARAKSRLLRLIACDGERLPFPDGWFDAAMCTLAVHHFRDPGRVFCEVRRVMRSGRFVIFTATAEQMRCYWLNEYFPQAMVRSIRQMPSLEFLRTTLDQAGFELLSYEPWFVPPDPHDLFLYSGKHRPKLYLDRAVRNGISTFAGLADIGEMETGIERLRRDIDSGRIGEVITSFQNDEGDYGFAVAQASSLGC